MATIYDFKAVGSNGKEIDFRQFEGKVLLIVNTASKCGYDLIDQSAFCDGNEA